MSRRERSERDAYNHQALWDALVPALPDGHGIAQRDQDACDVLRTLRDAFDDAVREGDRDRQLELIRRGMAVFALLSNEIADWLIDLPALDLQHERVDGKERSSLRMQMHLHEEALAGPNAASLDPMPLLLPRWLFLRLRDALEALGYGEVHPLVAPKVTGQHDDAWTWHQCRLRAVQHVAFLNGQGVAVGIARRRVGAAMKVSDSTLRDWERGLLETDREKATLAREAGELRVELESDLDNRSPMSGRAFALLRELQTSSLAGFGAAYQKQFGRRHNQTSAAD